MAGESEPIIETPAPIVAAEPPVVATPEPVAQVETTPAAPTPTLLETLTVEAPKPTEKPVEKVADKPADKPAEAVVAEKPTQPAVEAPVVYDLKFGENVTPQKEKVEAFTNFARELKMSPEHAQKAIDYFNEAASDFVKQQQQAQIDAWNKTRAEWRKQALADRSIGGAGHNTAMKTIARMRDMAISDAQPGSDQYKRDTQEFSEFLQATGAGDHPAFLKFIHRFGRYLDEPKLPPPNPNPVPGNGQRPNKGLYKPTGARS